MFIEDQEEEFGMIGSRINFSVLTKSFWGKCTESPAIWSFVKGDCVVRGRLEGDGSLPRRKQKKNEIKGGNKGETWRINQAGQVIMQPGNLENNQAKWRGIGKRAGPQGWTE